jgi:hypothetical protein
MAIIRMDLTMRSYKRSKSDFRARRRFGPMAALGALVFAGCDPSSFLEVSDPGAMSASDAQSAANAPTLMNGVIGDFECALGAFIVSMGALSEELGDRGFSGDTWFIDRRDILSSDVYGEVDCTGRPSLYVPISRARWGADNIATLLGSSDWGDVANKPLMSAQAALYSGFSYMMLGMSMCSAAIDGGAEVSNSALLTSAEAKFTEAIALASAAASTDIGNAAKVGRARARLGLGNGSGAVSDASEVPEGFKFETVSTSSGNQRAYNRVYEMTNQGQQYGIQEESWTLLTGGVEDPRTKSWDSGNIATGGLAIWWQDKYKSRGSALPIAHWEEAQLIIAEVTGGQTAVDIINKLRSAHPTLPQFASTDADAIADEVLTERRRELWLEGFAAWDDYRLNLPLNPVVGTPYQITVKGGIYGDSRCFPLPDIERFNNPNIS